MANAPRPSGSRESARQARRRPREDGDVLEHGLAAVAEAGRRAIKAVERLKESGDVQVGVNIVKRALEEPTRQIIANAGLEGSVIVRDLKDRGGNFGFNAQTEKTEDMFKAGIVDPAKVTKSALQNAASIAGLMLTTEVLTSADRITFIEGPSPLDDRRDSPPPADSGVVYPVWFGTNRKPAAQGDGFTGERHGRVTRGRVDVHVPEAHRFGETGTALWKRLLRFELRDDHLRIQRVKPQERDVFFAEIHAAMEVARDGGETPHALFFLHGFNVTFEEAAIRAAQIGCDLKVPGATAFFSWPSRGTVAAYPADEASIEASERAITDFLVDFTANCGAEKVHVIAHSMGNRGLLRALQRMAANAKTRGQVKFGQAFLAAPDVDRDPFLDLVRLYPEHAERTTLYASDVDLAVHISASLHDAPRAGYYEPYTIAPDVDTVAVPDFDVDLLGHSYYARAEALLHDIYDVMRYGKEPKVRQRLRPSRHAASVWELVR